MLYVFLTIVISLASFSGNLCANQLKIHVVSTMDRVFKDDVIQAQQDKKISISAARNEYESSQIMLNSDATVRLDDIKISSLVNMITGESLSSENCVIRVPEYVYVEWNTRATPKYELDSQAPAMYPDPLTDFSPFSFKGSRSIWLTCYIPTDASTGRYEGRLKLMSDDEPIYLPVELNVWNFSIPDESSMYITNWLHTSQLVKQYGVRRYTDKYWSLINLVAQDLKEHRQNVIFTRLNIIRVNRLSDTNYTFDFKNYEKWVGIFLKHGFKAIEAGPLFHPGSFEIVDSISRKKIKFNKSKLKKFLESDKGKLFLSQFLTEIHNKNKELGINDMYLQHVGDEAKVEEQSLYRDIVKLVHKHMPGVPVIDATHLDSHRRTGMMDIAVTNMHADESPVTNVLMSKWGKWWYTAGFRPRGKMPNRFIDYPLLKMRMISWLSWRYGMSGYLHYAYNWWQLPEKQSPWDKVQYKNYSPGDAWVVYPPRDQSIRAPISSLRWEIFRDGLEDYEYFALLYKSVETMRNTLASNEDTPEAVHLQLAVKQGDSLLSLLGSQLTSKTEYPRNPAKIEDIRNRLGEWLSTNVTESGVVVQ